MQPFADHCVPHHMVLMRAWSTSRTSFCFWQAVITTMLRDGGWDLVKGVRTSGPFHCQPYQCCNFTHSLTHTG